MGVPPTCPHHLVSRLRNQGRRNAAAQTTAALVWEKKRECMIEGGRVGE